MFNLAEPYLGLLPTALLYLAILLLCQYRLRPEILPSICRRHQHITYGLLWGLWGIIADIWHLTTPSGMVISLQDLAPLTAAFMFSATAGLIAGAVNALWLCAFPLVVVGLEGAAATFLLSLLATALQRWLFREQPICWYFGVITGWAMETAAILIKFDTYLPHEELAYNFINEAGFPMIFMTGLGLGLAIIARNLLQGIPFRPENDQRLLADRLQDWMVLCVLVIFTFSTAFTYHMQQTLLERAALPFRQENGILPGERPDDILQADLGELKRQNLDDLVLASKLPLYQSTMTQAIIFYLMLLLAYAVIQSLVIRSVRQIGFSLSKVADGKLDTVVKVDTSLEFRHLSQYLNRTMESLKQYIAESKAHSEHELELAREIQLSCLPSVFPAFPQHTEFDIYALSRTAREVGGDFYDFYFCAPDTLAILIADVSGKGIPAAMFMMNAKSALKSAVESGQPLNKVMEQANARLCSENDANMFVTVWLGTINLRTGQLCYVNAGHNPPVLLAGESPRLLDTEANLMLAAMENIRYIEYRLTMKPGDGLLLYTDGVSEAMDSSYQEFGTERLLMAIQAAKGATCHELCDSILIDVAAFVNGGQQFDDITMLSFQLREYHSEEEMISKENDLDTMAEKGE